MFSDPVFDSFLPKALAATSEDQVKQILRDANEFIARQHPEISLLTPNVFALYQPWLKGYSGQNMSISGTGSGILQMGFYTSRFWIDSVLKKSMGH
jgi:ABC-type transport system substrate-binding protein